MNLRFVYRRGKLYFILYKNFCFINSYTITCILQELKSSIEEIKHIHKSLYINEKGRYKDRKDFKTYSIP